MADAQAKPSRAGTPTGESTTAGEPAPTGARARSRRLVVAVDVVVLTVRHGELDVLLIRRLARHHKGEWALPGGFVGVEESLDDAALRELHEETGLDLDPTHVEQFRAYGDPGRDDRKDRRVITVAYLAIQPFHTFPELSAGTDAETAAWAAVDEIIDGRRPLAFDHAQIVKDAVERVGTQLEYTALATAFVPERFTEADLRTVYEAVWGLRDEPLDAPNFHRSLHTLTPPIVEPLLQQRSGVRGRPASLYAASRWVDEEGPLMRLDRPLAKRRRADEQLEMPKARASRTAKYKRRPN